MICHSTDFLSPHSVSNSPVDVQHILDEYFSLFDSMYTATNHRSERQHKCKLLLKSATHM